MLTCTSRTPNEDVRTLAANANTASVPNLSIYIPIYSTRMRDSIMDGQDKFIMRESDNAEVGAREDCDEDLLDVGCTVT